MSDKVGQLVVEMAANMARFESDMRHANRVSQDTMRKIGADVDRGAGAIQRSMSAMAGGIAGAFTVGAAIAFTREVTSAALAAEKMNMQFKASTGSAQAAAREMGYIRDLTNRMGLVFDSTATSYSKFLASTRGTSIEGQQSQKVFEGVTEAVTALGLSGDEANGIFLALSQMMSKGKVSAEELTGQLNERLPGATKMAADALGVTTAELLKMMQDGKVLSADLLPKLAEQLHKTYGKAAQEAATQGQSNINRFNNEVRETAKLIGSVAIPAINEMAGAMAAALKQWRTEGPGGLSNFSAALLPGGGTLSERFALPKPGEAMGFSERNAHIAASRATAIAASGGADPQMSRLAADRQAEQDRINASRAAAEKAAAGAAEREKKAKEDQLKRQRAVNAELQLQNRLIEESVKGWDLAGLGQGLEPKGGMLNWKPSKPVFSLTGASSSFNQMGPTSEQLKADADAIAESIAEQAEAFSRVNMEIADYQKLLFDQTAIGGATNALNDYIAAAENMGDQVYGTIVNGLASMEDAMVDFTMTGKASFSDMANSIISDLVRIAYRKAIIAPLAQGFGNAMGWAINGFQSSDMTAPGAGPQLPSYDVGTPYVPRTGLALIHEGEAIIPAAQNRAGFGGGNVQVNVINPPGEKNEVASKNMRFDGEQWIVDVVLKKYKADPGFRAALSGGMN